MLCFKKEGASFLHSVMLVAWSAPFLHSVVLVAWSCSFALFSSDPAVNVKQSQAVHQTLHLGQFEEMVGSVWMPPSFCLKRWLASFGCLLLVVDCCVQ
eukprot:10004515-Ditylum_brightwellii.AAC.1